jgi:CO dehydrogenase nickel-insertion accessory protein CooC1
VLLTGARGTGKSSLVKALLNEYAKKGLRLIEVDRDDLVDLPDIVDLIAGRPSASSSSATTCRSNPANRLQGAEKHSRRLGRGVPTTC